MVACKSATPHAHAHPETENLFSDAVHAPADAVDAQKGEDESVFVAETSMPARFKNGR